MSGHRWATVTVVGLGLLVGGYALAHGPSERHQRGGMPSEMTGGMMEMMHGMMGHGDAAERPLISLMLQHREALDLSPEQVQKLETLRSDFRKGAIKRSADLQVAELELEELQRKEPVDLAKVEAQLKRVEALRTEKRLSRIKTIEEGKALLSPEQRKKLDTLGQRVSGGHATGMTGCPMMGGMGR